MSVGQAQKEFTHNEALQILDVVAGGAVEGPPSATPPATPMLGACSIVGDGAAGAWAGKSRQLAAWTSGGWRPTAPTEGMSHYERTSGTFATFRNGSWDVGILHAQSIVIGGAQVVGARAGAIESPTGGTVVDTEGRAAIDAILDTLREHGLIAQ